MKYIRGKLYSVVCSFSFWGNPAEEMNKKGKKCWKFKEIIQEYQRILPWTLSYPSTFQDEVRADNDDWKSLGMHGNQSRPMVCEATVDEDRLIGPYGKLLFNGKVCVMVSSYVNLQLLRKTGHIPCRSTLKKPGLIANSTWALFVTLFSTQWLGNFA